jgi:hypothetical protein
LACSLLPTASRQWTRRVPESLPAVGVLDGDPSDRERRARSIVALMVGAVTISRAMTDEGESRATAIDAARHTAISLVDTQPSRSSRKAGKARSD